MNIKLLRVLFCRLWRLIEKWYRNVLHNSENWQFWKSFYGVIKKLVSKFKNVCLSEFISKIKVVHIVPSGFLIINIAIKFLYFQKSCKLLILSKTILLYFLFKRPWDSPTFGITYHRLRIIDFHAWIYGLCEFYISTDNRIGKLFSNLVISFHLQVTTFNDVEQLDVRPVGDREQK